MKFLMYSTSGEGADILATIAQEGNTVGLYIKDKIYKSVFDGLVQKVNNPDDFIDKDTIIIFDISGNGKVADSYRKKGHHVYGGGSFQDKLEHDRVFGFTAMIEAGIKIPIYKEFTDFKNAKKYVASHENRLVFKPTGSMPCKLTYVSKDSNELLVYLDFVEKHFSDSIDSFILQDFVEGIVVSSEYYCSKAGFIDPPNHTVEVKKSMNDDLGPSTGCSGNITWPCHYDPVIDKGIYRIQDICEENEMLGQIDLNSVVTEDGDVYGLEWTPRFGYDATPVFLRLLREEYGKFFSDIARGAPKRDMNIRDIYSASVRVSIPPYPVETKMDTERFSPSKGIPILNHEKHGDDIYFYEVCYDQGELVHSGGTGVIACTIGTYDTPSKSLKYAYEIAEDLVIPDKQYRTDLNKVLPEMVRKVEEYA